MRSLLACCLLLCAALSLVSVVCVDAAPNRPCPSLPLPVSLPNLSAALAQSLKDYDVLLGQAVESGNIPAFISIIVYDQQVLWTQGYGKRNFTDPNSEEPDENSLIRIASLTKLMTSQLLFQLSHDNHLSLDDDLSSCMPGFSMRTWPTQNARTERPISLRALAQHTSGVPREQPCPWGTCSEAEVLEQLRPMYLLSQPDTSPHYSNLGFSLLGRCMGHKMGAEYETLVDREVFARAQMEDSSFAPTAGQLSRLAVGLADDGVSPALPLSDLTWDNPCGGAFTTASDMAKWMSFLFRNTELPSASPAASSKGQQANATFNDFFEVATLLPDGVSGFGAPWEMNYSSVLNSWMHIKAGQLEGYRSNIALALPLKLGVFTIAMQDSTKSNTVWATDGLETVGPALIELLQKAAQAVPLPSNVGAFEAHFEGGVSVWVDQATQRMMVGPTPASVLQRRRLPLRDDAPTWGGDLLVVTEFADATSSFPAFRVQLADRLSTTCRWLDDGSDGEIMYLRMGSPQGPPSQLVFMGNTFNVAA